MAQFLKMNVLSSSGDSNVCTIRNYINDEIQTTKQDQYKKKVYHFHINTNTKIVFLNYYEVHAFTCFVSVYYLNWCGNILIAAVTRIPQNSEKPTNIYLLVGDILS